VIGIVDDFLQGLSSEEYENGLGKTAARFYQL
jgi:hypothetical protein